MAFSILFGSIAVKAVSSDVPAAPGSVSATATSPKGSTKISWKAVDGAKGYIVYRSKTVTGGYQRLTVTDDTNYVTAGRLYNYKIRAYKVVNGTTIFGAFSKVFSTPEISIVGMKSEMPGATLLQAWKVADNSTGTTVLVQKLSYGSPITVNYNGKNYKIQPACFIAIVNCKPANIRNTCASLTFHKSQAFVNDMAKKVNALIAINNEGFTGHWNPDPNVKQTFLTDGPVVKESKVVQNKKGATYLASAIYKDGTWLKDKSISPANVNAEIRNGLSYTQAPSNVASIWDGKQIRSFWSQTNIFVNLRNRTLYGQIDANNYLLMVGEFMQVDTLTSVLLHYGAQKGFVCNGGNCSFMYLKGVGNVTGTTSPTLSKFDKLNMLEQEWKGDQNLLSGGKGSACQAIDIVYVK